MLHLRIVAFSHSHTSLSHSLSFSLPPSPSISSIISLSLFPLFFFISRYYYNVSLYYLPSRTYFYSPSPSFSLLPSSYFSVLPSPPLPFPSQYVPLENLLLNYYLANIFFFLILWKKKRNLEKKKSSPSFSRECDLSVCVGTENQFLVRG